MRWIPKAAIAFANDAITALFLRDNTTETHGALREVVGELVPPGVADALSDPAVSSIVSNAVDERVNNLAVLQSLGVVTDQFEVAVGDADGRPTWMRADKAGAPTPGVIDALASKGVTRATTGTGEEYEVAVGDEEGRATWMRANSLGWPSAIATEIIRAAGGFRVGPVEPTIYPGLPVIWFQTDGYGNLIDIQGVGL